MPWAPCWRIFYFLSLFCLEAGASRVWAGASVAWAWTVWSSLCELFGAVAHRITRIQKAPRHCGQVKRVLQTGKGWKSCRAATIAVHRVVLGYLFFFCLKVGAKESDQQGRLLLCSDPPSAPRWVLTEAVQLHSLLTAAGAGPHQKSQPALLTQLCTDIRQGNHPPRQRSKGVTNTTDMYCVLPEWVVIHN